MTLPKLKSLLVRDFRSISGEWRVPLDADVVLVHGQNGAGKTSVLSALELAATGTISHLDRLGDQSYKNHLHHRGARTGQVELHVDGLDGLGAGSASLSASGVDVAPLLHGPLAEIFVERCFLPQATLSRLFEVYAPGVGGDDTPLIRFVKELLGLDQLDALIDGLHPSRHVARAQKLSSAWQVAEMRQDDERRAFRQAEEVQRQSEQRVKSLSEVLDRHLRDFGFTAPGDTAEELLSQAHRLVETMHRDDTTMKTARHALLRLDAVAATLAQSPSSAADLNDSLDGSHLQVVEARYSDWWESRAQPLAEWATTNLGIADPKTIAPSVLLRHVVAARTNVEVELVDAQKARRVMTDLDVEIHSVMAREEEVAIELDQLDASRHQLSSSSAATALSSVLMSVLEHIEGSTCPVCDQNFGQGESLRTHVLAKAEALSSEAARLLELEELRAALAGEQQSLAQRLAERKSRREQLGDVRVAEVAIGDQARNLNTVKLLVSIAEAGALLEEEVARARDQVAAQRRDRALFHRLVAELDEIAQILKVDLPKGLLPQRVAALRAVAQHGLDELARNERKVSDLLRSIDELQSAIGQRQFDLTNATQARQALAATAARIEEARRRKEVASTLHKRAEEVRADSITRVFDERLNGTWARLFGALVPSEPFVPQFKRNAGNSRRVSVEMETVDRDGLGAASPAAMLSQGNLNTAALSLFVALHFAVPTTLPWLIFDDPVQSMDDLHISNFAALVKQLTRRNGQQVVIAVHQKELFDYLALELTPASPTEELLAITLDRTYGQTVIDINRQVFREDTALLPLSAA